MMKDYVEVEILKGERQAMAVSDNSIVRDIECLEIFREGSVVSVIFPYEKRFGLFVAAGTKHRGRLNNRDRWVLK